MARTVEQIAEELKADASGPLEATVSDVTHDSRRAGRGALFVAVSGLHHGGNTFVDAAM